LKLVYTPVDDNVTVPHKSQVTSHKSRGFRKGRSSLRGNLARTPDVAVVISLKLVFGPCG